MNVNFTPRPLVDAVIPTLPASTTTDRACSWERRVKWRQNQNQAKAYDDDDHPAAMLSDSIRTALEGSLAIIVLEQDDLFTKSNFPTPTHADQGAAR